MSGLFNAIKYYQKASMVGNILKANVLECTLIADVLNDFYF